MITKFPAEKLMVAGAHYVTVEGPLPTEREHEAPPSQGVLEMIQASAREEGAKSPNGKGKVGKKEKVGVTR